MIFDSVLEELYLPSKETIPTELLNSFKGTLYLVEQKNNKNE